MCKDKGCSVLRTNHQVSGLHTARAVIHFGLDYGTLIWKLASWNLLERANRKSGVLCLTDLKCYPMAFVSALKV